MNHMKKRISWMLTFAMLLSMIAVPIGADTAVTLQDAGFEGDIWKDGIWSYWIPADESWSGKTVENFLYSSDSWMTPATDGGNQCIKFYLSSAGSFYFTQVLTNVSAGTYTLSVDSMGAGGETVYVKLGDMLGETVQTNSGYNSWVTSSGTFTLTEDCAELIVGVYVECSAGGWGYFDNLTLTAHDTAEPEMTELTLPNGDFELGNSGNWVLSGYSEVSTDQWASNNSTYALSLWLSDTAAAGSASYPVTLTAGTYYFTFDLAGADSSSNLSYTITSGDTALVTGADTYTTTGWDAWQTVTTETFTLTEETEVTFTLSGTQPAGYWGDLDNLKLFGDGAVVEQDPEKVEADIYVPYISGTDGDFMRGMDVSSLLSLLKSGVTYKDWDGNELDGQGFMNLLADSGTNWIRLRVWNNPYDADGNGYGGGNCDLDAAITMGKWATNAGMQVLIDFHYSDFWADPGKQYAPKAWADYTVDEKADAIYNYTKDSLTALINAGVDVGMVQIGNETTNSLCGVSNWADRCTLFSAGAKAVREIDDDILVAIHFTNPERSGNYANFAAQLNTYGVDYDVFASSYYPYWHGTLENLTSVLKTVADTYDKQVIVAETSWAYTLEDGDGWANTVSASSGYDDLGYPFSVQGQAAEISAVAQAVRNVGDAGIGIFYWESAWLPVGTPEELEDNQLLWETYGSGWASSYAGGYCSDAAEWYGGSAVDNQALFAFDGTPLESLKTYLYMQTGTTGYEVVITEIENADRTYLVGDTLALPDTLHVTYNDGTDEDLAVIWNENDVAAVNMSVPGTYTVTGTIGEDTAVTSIVTVLAENLLDNPGFELSDMSMYTISQSYAKRTTDDPYAGSYSLHFYNSSAVSFTAQQTVTLQPGHYTFSLYGQGGDLGSDAVCYAYVTVGEETLTDTFSLTGWKNWVNPTISFDVTEETEVTVGISVTGAGGGWGTFDDWYLRQNLSAAHTPGEDDGDCTTPVYCTVCGQTATAANAAHSFDATGKCVNCNAQAVAKIGDTCFLTFADAAASTAEGDTVTLLADVTITESETVTFANWVKLDVGTYTITNNGTVLIGNKDALIFENTLYYNGGDATETGLFLRDDTPATYYTTGDGYAIFHPGDGVNPGELYLNNATIYGVENVLDGSSATSIGIYYRYWTDSDAEENRDLIIHFSGTNTVTGRTGPDGSDGIYVSYGSLTLDGEENAVLNISSGNANNVSTGLSANNLYITVGTVNATAGQDIPGTGVVLQGELIVSEGATLNATGNPIGFSSSTVSGNVNGLGVSTTVDVEASTITVEYTAYGNAVLANDLTIQDLFEADDVTFVNIFTVPAGTSLTNSTYVTLDLSAMAISDIDLSGTVINNATIILPDVEGMTGKDIPHSIIGSVVCIGDRSYFWNEMYNYWNCFNLPHVAEADDGDCTTEVCCIYCDHVEIAAYTEHNYTVAFEGAARVEATCVATGSAEMKCEYCDQIGIVELPIDPENHTGETELRNALDATADADGYTGDLHCSDCDELLAYGESIPKLETEPEESESTEPEDPNDFTEPDETEPEDDVKNEDTELDEDEEDPTEPEETEPEETEPEETEPEATEPEETEPEATEPEATEPEATEPEATEPEATEPEATEPEATEPEATEPDATEPEATEPEATEPEATEPEATEPEATEPEATEPEATEPEATEPEATEPEATEPEETEPEETEPEATEPEATEPEATEPEATEPEVTEPEATEPETGDNADTGDHTPMMLLLMVMTAALAVVLILIDKLHKQLRNF